MSPEIADRLVLLVSGLAGVMVAQTIILLVVLVRTMERHQ